MLSGLHDALRARGLEPPENIEPGRFIRFAANGKASDRAAWVKMFEDGQGAIFGDWREGWSETWQAGNDDPTPAQRAEWRQKIESAKREAEERRENAARAAAKKAAELWAAAKPAPADHPYLIRKGIAPGIARVTADGLLLIPVYGPNGALASTQTIAGDGAKRFQTDGRMKGGYAWLKAPESGAGRVLLVEGYATGQSVSEATTEPVACAFSAGNLPDVARMLKAQGYSVVVAGDNGNAGRAKGDEAARAVGGTAVYPPELGDWNDYHQKHGLDALRKALAGAPGHRFRLVRAGDIEPKAPQWLIRDYLEADSLALVFGDPGCAKSFAAVGMACCIAAGLEWHGRRVKQAPVIYIAGEGHNGIARRLRAWSIRHGIDLQDAPLYVSTAPAALCDPLSVAHVEMAVDEITAEHGKPGLVTIDTVARNFGPGDENSTQDMTLFIAAADRIRTKYGCTVLLVHHTGHADKTRARGAMALKGALDAEYRMDKDEAGVVRFEATKMKDAEHPDPMAFRICTVELPLHDEDGQPVTSAVLDETGYEPPVKGKAGGGKWQTLGMEVLQELRQTHRANREAAGHDPDGARVSVEDWRAECIAQEMPRRTWYKVRDTLLDQKEIRIDHGFVV
jgi:putative DNA primase/helicase